MLYKNIQLKSFDDLDTLYPITKAENVICNNEIDLQTHITQNDARISKLESQMSGYTIWVGTQDEYDSILEKDPLTIYNIHL